MRWIAGAAVYLAILILGIAALHVCATVGLSDFAPLPRPGETVWPCLLSTAVLAVVLVVLGCLLRTAPDSRRLCISPFAATWLTSLMAAPAAAGLFTVMVFVSGDGLPWWAVAKLEISAVFLLPLAALVQSFMSGITCALAPRRAFAISFLAGWLPPTAFIWTAVLSLT